MYCAINFHENGLKTRNSLKFLLAKVSSLKLLKGTFQKDVFCFTFFENSKRVFRNMLMILDFSSSFYSSRNCLGHLGNHSSRSSEWHRNTICLLSGLFLGLCWKDFLFLVMHFHLNILAFLMQVYQFMKLFIFQAN